MKVASLDLCRELYELSGWDEPRYLEEPLLDTEEEVKGWYGKFQDLVVAEAENLSSIPRYTLGYLLRKLPRATRLNHYGPSTHHTDEWGCSLRGDSYHGQPDVTEDADTPEDAAAKLAIKLFKEGILKKERSAELKPQLNNNPELVK